MTHVSSPDSKVACKETVSINLRVLFQCAAILTLPFDVVKTHRQIELGEAEMKHSE